MKRRPAAVPLALRQIELSEDEAKPDCYDEPDDNARLQNDLVTAAKLLNAEDTISDPPLRDPSKLSKEEFPKSLFDSLSNPMFASSGRPRERSVDLDIYYGVKEGPDVSAHQHAGISFYKQQQADCKPQPNGSLIRSQIDCSRLYAHICRAPAVGSCREITSRM